MLLLVLIQNSRVTHYHANILARANHHISININAIVLLLLRMPVFILVPVLV